MKLLMIVLSILLFTTIATAGTYETLSKPFASHPMIQNLKMPSKSNFNKLLESKKKSGGTIREISRGFSPYQKCEGHCDYKKNRTHRES